VLRLYHLTFACEDPRRVCEFWAEALGYQVERGGDDWFARGDPELRFAPMPKSPTIEVPIHVDVNTPDPETEIQRLLGLGARLVVTKTDRVGEISETWTVMRDPEGNGFCVQGPDERMPSTYLRNVTYAAAEPPRLAEFWSQATGWPVEEIPEAFLDRLRAAGIDERELDAYAAIERPGTLLRFLFQRRQKTPTESIPIHPDFRTHDREAELERLTALGASVMETKHAADRTWTVMRDLEGNAFCVGVS
jgi:predicted enzyme related to lactoylglutathione lyase